MILTGWLPHDVKLKSAATFFAPSMLLIVQIAEAVLPPVVELQSLPIQVTVDPGFAVAVNVTAMP
jgi:uncharacterized membrane protein YvlD (DUF360 family)